MAKKEAKLIYQRPNSPNWYYRFWIESQEFRGSTGETTERKALLVALQKQEEAIADAEKRAAGHSEKTLSEMVEAWWESVGKTQDDHKNTRSILDKLLGKMTKRRMENGKYVRTPDGGFELVSLPGLNPARLVHQLTKREVTELYDQRLRDGNSKATANREIAKLQAVVTWGRSRSFRVMGWWTDFKDVKQEEPKGKVRHITLEDEKKLLAELDPKGDHRRVDQYHFVLAALDLGARYNEVATLQWDDVDFTEGTILIYRKKTKNRDTLVMTDRLFNAMADRWNSRDVTSPYVFPGDGESGHRSYATKGIRKAMQRAGLNDTHKVERYGKATVHTCRDTLATKVVSNGGSLYDVQKILGHASPQMSQKYAHAQASEASKRAALILNKLNQGAA